MTLLVCMFFLSLLIFERQKKRCGLCIFLVKGQSIFILVKTDNPLKIIIINNANKFYWLNRFLWKIPGPQVKTLSIFPSEGVILPNETQVRLLQKLRRSYF